MSKNNLEDIKVTKPNGRKNTTNAKSSATKKNTTKSNAVKKTTNTVKKSSNTAKKTNTKKKDIKVEEKVLKTKPVVEEVKIEKVEQKKEEKVTLEEVSNVNGAKIENAKFTVRKSNKLAISIGVFISFLGIVALIISLIANRIIDREFINDTEILVMVIVSIIIEIMGAAIIVKES